MMNVVPIKKCFQPLFDCYCRDSDPKPAKLMHSNVLIYLSIGS